MNILPIFDILYIILMMIIDFIILGEIFRKEYIRRRAALFLTSFIGYMGVEAFAIGDVLFYHGSLLIELLLIPLASIPLILSTFVKDEVIRLKSDILTGLTFAITITVDELAMGYLYSGAFGPHTSNLFVNSVSNVAFAIMMMTDGLFFLAISKSKNITEISLATFAISMAFLPSLYLGFPKEIELIVSIITSVIMVINIITLYLIEIKRITLEGQLFSISLALLDFLMMLGLDFFVIFRDLLTISLMIFISMIWYFILLLHSFPQRKINFGIKYPFLFMIFVNLAELSMGLGESVLGYRSIEWLFPYNPLMMAEMMISKILVSNLVLKALFISFAYIMSITMTPFYVIMMGAEMSYLVYERFKHVKKVKKWSLVIITGIPLFTVLIPYYTDFYVFGMSGMILPVTLLPFIISIIAVMVASSLFGRRAYCNAVCMAAHMWTNVFYDQFKPKRSSKIWDYLRWIFIFPMFLTFELYIGEQLNVINLPLNPLNLYGMLVLNYVWWFFYFLTPFFGTYSCARQGWCGFGTFAGFFNKVLFKISAKDVNVCGNCEVKSCEASCSIKIPISKDILNKGYTNRISCVGCGDCVEACPYENLEIIDIRKYISKS